MGDDRGTGICHDRFMLNELSTQMADAVDRAASSVVQVQGRRRPASGIVYADGAVVTTMRAIGGDDGLHVRRPDGTVLDAALAGWDPATTLAVLRVANLGLSPLEPGIASPRVGHLALALARSWSNAVTASAGIIAVIGGPLPTGRRRAIDQVIRTTAPMHDGFSGGALIDTSGGLVGVTTATAIRGTTVVIPAGIAWAAAQRVLEHGQARRGYLGLVGQSVKLSQSQAASCGRDTALLVLGVAPESAAASAGVLVGDIVLALDETVTPSPEDLLDLLATQQAGRRARLKLLRGGTVIDLPVTIGERPTR
jgi:S1-C subfamily serine protease